MKYSHDVDWKERLLTEGRVSFTLKEIANFAMRAYPGKFSNQECAYQFVIRAKQKGELAAVYYPGFGRPRITRAEAVRFFGLTLEANNGSAS